MSTDSSDSGDARVRFAQATEITTATYDRVARNYADRNDVMQPHWAERMEQFVDLLAENDERQPILDQGRPGDDATLEEYIQFVPALDAGCGPGRDARALAAYGLPVLGADISQGMLDEAGERTARRLPVGFIRYALMDLRRLDLPDASCRGVWCSASLLHLPLRSAPRAMRELARVTRAGGPLAVFLKRRAPDGVAEQLQQYEHLEGDEGQRFFAYYTPDEARALLEDAGAEILDLATVPDQRSPESMGWVTLLARKPC
jgi:SAM-dependent methyltransferase